MNHQDGFVIGVDVGTSMVKVGVYGFDGTERALLDAPLPLEHLAPGRVEQDLNDFYSVAATLCRRCLAENDIAAESVKAIAFSAQMAGVGIVDANHEPAAPFDSWLDTRCGPTVDELAPFSAAVVASSGCAPTISIGPKMAWWHRNEPTVLANAASFVTAAGFVAGKAVGRRGNEAFIDPTHLHFASVADVATASWNSELVEAFVLDDRLLPEIVESAAIVGTVTAAAAADFGLRMGTPVAAGCGDTAASAFGAGALGPGTAIDIAGTAGVFAAALDSFTPDIQGRTLMTMRAALPGHWYALAYVGGAGQVVEWVCRAILGHKDLGQEAYDALSHAVLSVEAGCDGLVLSPHFDGRVTPVAPAMRGSLIGLNHLHTRSHIARAALESIAFEYRHYLDTLTALQPDWVLTNIVGAGGGTKNPAWNQIKADVLGAPYAPLAGIDPGTRGAALVAMAALDMNLPILAADSLAEPSMPDSAVHDTYLAIRPMQEHWANHLSSGYRTQPQINTPSANPSELGDEST